MAGIFISYRRADSDGWAGRLRDALRVRFGDRVFQDVDNIADGEIFSEVIDRALQECDVALVIIGPNWASARDERGRRLDQEDDWVRTETAMVLNRRIRVIPVLVGGASLPRAEDLPEELRSLTRRQAREIRSNSWDSDVALLANHLKQIVGHHGGRAVWLYASAAAIVLAVVGVFAGSRFFDRPAPAPALAEKTAASVAVAPVERERTPPASPSVVQSPPPTAGEMSVQKQPEVTPPITTKAPAAPATTAPVPVSPPSPSRTATAKSPGREVSASARDHPTIARAEPPAVKAAPAPSVTASRKPAAVPAQEPRKAAIASTREAQKSAVAKADATAPADRMALTAPAAPEARAPEAPQAGPAVAVPAIARTAPLNLPNRPSAARALRIGDSWTYRLRELQFNRNLATVTHEIGGGDKSGIREMVRTGERTRGADADAESAPATQRRLPLEPRIFEQSLGQNATLFEFAPFMTAFSELQPGVRWNKIAGATSSDSINDWRFSGKVIGRERVRVPAGDFDAIKAELEGELDVSFPSTRDSYNETTASYQTYAVWFVPEIGRAIKYERRTYNRGRRLLDHEQYELLSYQLK